MRYVEHWQDQHSSNERRGQETSYDSFHIQ
jgi:hypothetical protein